MPRQLALPLGFNPELGFDQFWPGSNGEAVAHLRRAALGQTEALIVIWGDSGTGKTHLLNASCAAASRAGRSAAYLPLSLLREHGPGALEGVESFALLCLDDLQTIAGDRDFETALFDLFNRVRETEGQLMASATLPSPQLDFVLPDLASRLAWGLTLRLQPLDDADTLEALALKARTLGLELSPAVGRFLMHHARRDLPALTTLLEQLDRASLAAQRKLTVPFVKRHIGEHS